MTIWAMWNKKMFVSFHEAGISFALQTDTEYKYLQKILSILSHFKNGIHLSELDVKCLGLLV